MLQGAHLHMVACGLQDPGSVKLGLLAMAAEAAREAREDVARGKGKALVGNYSCRGLANAWDNRAAVRNRLRESKRLLHNFDNKLKQGCIANQVEKSMYNLRLNADVLSPVLHLVRSHNQLLPMIDFIIEEMQTLYSTYKIQISGELVYHDAWSIRSLISLLKGEHGRLVAEAKKETRKRKCKDL